MNARKLDNEPHAVGSKPGGMGAQPMITINPVP